MQLVRFVLEGKQQWGVLEDGAIRPVEGSVFEDFQLSDQRVSLSSVKLLAPAVPTKIVAVGLNYRDHAVEMGEELPENPKIFLKPSTAVIGPSDSIVLPPSSSRVDYEAELALVVKRRAKNIDAREADEYILGYTCFNDVTARDLQSVDGQWTRAKSFDTFAPVGPVINTSVDPHALDIESRVNGELRQKSNTRNLIFGPEQLLSFVSRVMTLLPGDIIATGTPSGVGPLGKGDTVEVAIRDIGVLANSVI